MTGLGSVILNVPGECFFRNLISSPVILPLALSLSTTTGICGTNSSRSVTLLADKRRIARVVDAAILETVKEFVGDRGQPERAAEFAVGIDLDAGIALHLQHVEDRLVFDRLQLGVIDLAVQAIDARFAQFGRTYQAAAMIGAEDRLCHKGGTVL